MSDKLLLFQTLSELDKFAIFNSLLMFDSIDAG